MKTFVFSTLLFIVIVSLLVFNFFSIEKKSEELKSILQKLEDAIKDENDENINKYLNKASIFWQDKKDALFVVSNHRDLDELSHIFEKLKIRINQKRYNEAIEEIILAKFYLDDITANEFPSFSNIF